MHQYLKVYQNLDGGTVHHSDHLSCIQMFAQNVQHTSRWHIFAGIPFIAVCGDHSDRNLQANSELVCPKAVRGYVQGDCTRLSASVFKCCRANSEGKKGALLVLSRLYQPSGHLQTNISITKVHVTLKHLSVKQFLYSGHCKRTYIHGQLGHVPVSLIMPVTESFDTVAQSHFTWPRTHWDTDH